jgi:tRNA-specific 2-thiouridylase
MYRPVDLDRDQSYFLYATTQEQLDFLRFPLGSMTKPETRELAREFGLVVADKHDSQDICFVPTGKYADVIERLKPGASESGEIIHVDGRVLGHHDGIIHYTVGQRRGIGVSVGEPLYVVHLDSEKRRVVVGPRDSLLTRRLRLRDVNWLGDRPLSALTPAGLDVWAKVRSTRPPQAARLLNEAGEIVVELASGEQGIAPGQAAVFYDAPEGAAHVLGGGTIARVERSLDAEIALRRLAGAPAIHAAE